jgi:hypothetical protein
MELHATPRLFGLAFMALLAATVAFLIGAQIWSSGAPFGFSAPAARPIEVDIPVEVRVDLEQPSPQTVPPVSPVDRALSAFSGTLRAGVDPSLPVGAGQGVLELTGPAEVSVEVDEVERGTLPLSLVLDEGTHRVRYRFGARATDRFYYVKPGATRSLEVVTPPGGFVDAR